MVPDTFLDELRRRTPLVSLIGRRIKLSKSGREHVGLCCFHSERTPSLTIYPDHYMCYGCNERGDAIDFVQKTQGLDWLTAVEQLALEAGLEMPGAKAETCQATTERRKLVAAAEANASRWSAALWGTEGSEALSYLRSRGLDDATLSRFRVGWAGSNSDQLYRNRVVFPIVNGRGDVVSFSGRVLTEEKPKYVNGPESPIFSKGKTLFGLAESGRRKNLFLVEGAIDVLAMQQAGVGAVASMGTAITADQIAEAWKSGANLILAFDGDAAGQKATRRAIDLALPMLKPNRTIRVLDLVAGKDPAALLQANPLWTEMALATAKPLGEALFDSLVQQHDLTSTEGRAAFRNAMDETAWKIKDRGLSAEYRLYLRNRFFVRPERRSWTPTAKPSPPIPAVTNLSRHMELLDSELEVARKAAANDLDDERSWRIVQGLENEKERALAEEEESAPWV